MKTCTWVALYGLVCALACQPAPRQAAEASSEQGQSLPQAVEQFEQDREILLASMDSLQVETDSVARQLPPATDSTGVETLANDPALQLEQRVNDWELRWDGLITQYRQLHSSLEGVRLARDRQFAEMNETAAQISDRQARTAELKANSRAYAAFNRQYKVFYRSLGHAQSRVYKGRDLLLRLKTTMLRYHFRAETIGQVKDYAAKTRALINEMDSTLAQGRELAREIEAKD